MNTQESQPLTDQQCAIIRQTMNEERADELLLYAEVYAKQDGAKAARLVDLHPDSMDLELEFLYSTPKRVKIKFSHPIGDAREADRHFDQLSRKAHDLRGDTSHTPMSRRFAKLLPRWLRH